MIWAQKVLVAQDIALIGCSSLCRVHHECPLGFTEPPCKTQPPCGQQVMASQRSHILISATCDYVNFYSERDFADVIKLRISRWGEDPRSSRVITRVLIRRRQGRKVREGASGSGSESDALTVSAGVLPKPKRQGTALPRGGRPADPS